MSSPPRIVCPTYRRQIQPLIPQDRTYRDFLGPLWWPPWMSGAECVFANPVADLAVLARPDSQELSDRADAYDHLIEAATPFTVGRLPKSSAGGAACPAIRRPATHGCCRSTASGSRAGSQALARVLWVEAAAQPIKGGMSGSPVILPDGGAVAALVTGNQRDDCANAPLDSGTGGTGQPKSDAVRSAAGVAGACGLLNKTRRAGRPPVG